MLGTLPKSVEEIRDWAWSDLEPFFTELQNRTLTAENVEDWLKDWTQLSNLVSENFSRARVATTQDTADEEAETYLKHLLTEIYPNLSRTGNALDKKLLASGFTPAGMELPLKKMRVDTEMFREENIPLATREQALGLEYNKITGAQSVQWEGEDITLQQLNKVQEDHDRAKREQAWRLSMNRWLQDREAVNNLWTQFFETRQQMAKNAGFDDYRAYRWQFLKRFDYSPQDCETFHDAIEKVVVPAAKRSNERRRAKLGLETLRPWDTAVDTEGRPALKPYEEMDEFIKKAETIFNHVDPQLGEYFTIMRREALLDLPNRKNKGPGAYCTRFAYAQRPFVFMNAVGTRGDIRTLLHEVGHAFHGFEVLKLPYNQQHAYPMEFAEVASMSMELLAAPYLTHEHGGYFTPEDAARDRVEHLEKIIHFWPYMAVVDAFQHWVYTSGNAAADPAACDAKWAELWDRFQFTDYSGLQAEKETGWHRKQHIHRYPFYYVEYGLAQLGAVQVWANALDDQAGAVAAYRRGLSLGGTASLPELFSATGAKFAFDADTLGKAVNLIEETIERLSQ